MGKCYTKLYFRRIICEKNNYVKKTGGIIDGNLIGYIQPEKHKKFYRRGSYRFGN